MNGTLPELVAPAGTPDKLKTALHFGADAVYLGLKRFSLRSFAGNFTLDELEWALAFAHEQGRRIYVALNIQPFDEDLAALEPLLRQLSDLRPDGLIIADPGVLALARQHAPGLPLHLSTQASVTNAAAAHFWAEQGVRRIVVARELSLEQLEKLVPAAAPVQIEAFAHGAVCIAWSGRCLLSLYGADRDPRRGACAQGCRWAWRELEDPRRPGQGHPVEQDERGTYFFDAKDLCALPVLDRLVASGVHALKLEGRTRSVYYLGITVDIYRAALDRLAAGDEAGFNTEKSRYIEELACVSRRGFSTHFLTGSQDDPASYLPQGSPPDGPSAYAGQVLANDREALRLKVVNPLHPGAVLELCDRGLCRESVVLSELRAPDGSLLTLARSGSEIVIPGRFAAGPGALARHTRLPAPS